MKENIDKKDGPDVKDVLHQLGFYADWHLAGIPGGIPRVSDIFETINPGDDINAAVQRAGDAVRDSGGASAGNLRVLQLTEGIFNTKPIIMNRSGVILRGMGMSTIIRGNNNDSAMIEIGGTGKNEHTEKFMQKPVDLINSVKINDRSITVANASDFKPGMILKIDRFTDDAPASAGGSEWVNGHNQFMRTNTENAYGPLSEGGIRAVSQYIEIADIESNTLHLTNKINIDFPLKGAQGKNLNPQVWDTKAHEYIFIGLENMKLQVTAGNDDRGPWSWHFPGINFRLSSAYCHIKDIESDGTFFDEHNRGFMGRHVELNGYRNHVTGGYFHHSSQISPGGNGYGIRWHGTDCIIDNNICDFLNKPLLGQTSNGGNVIAYNYVPNAVIAPWDGDDYIEAATPGKPQPVDTWIETAIDPSHGGYSHSDLFEGNFAANIHTDPTSNNGYEVLFRNHSFGTNKGGKGPDGTYYGPEHWTTGSKNTVAIDGPQNEHVSIGNVYLTPETALSANVWENRDNKEDRESKEDPEPKKDIIVYRFGAGNRNQYNYTTEENGEHPDGGRRYAFERFYWAHDYNYIDNDTLSKEPSGKWLIPSKSLPDSLFLAKKPDYFEGYIWPPVNPFDDNIEENKCMNNLPAKDRYNRYK